MTVKELLSNAIVLLNKNELLSTSTFLAGPTATEPTVSQTVEINSLLKCFNLVYQEIAGNYIPLLCEEKIDFSDNKYYFSGLTNNIQEIFSLVDENGENVDYTLFPNFIKTRRKTAGAYLCYSYIPQDFVITNNTVNLFSGKVLPQVFAYGIAREFCVLQGDFQTAEFWEDRYKNGLKLAVRKKTKVNIKPLRWL